jgi:hypothetical protein
MNHAIHVEQPAGVTQSPRPQPVRVCQLQAEQNVESRLNGLGDEIQFLIEAPYPGLLQDRDSIREALDELTTKHTTLLWTARVAKCTEGAVRERLWLDIEKALASLERVASSLVRSESR